MRWGTAKEYAWYYKTLKFDGYRFLVWLKEGNADLHQLVLKELEIGRKDEAGIGDRAGDSVPGPKGSSRPPHRRRPNSPGPQGG
jgi:hypothetical protein